MNIAIREAVHELCEKYPPDQCRWITSIGFAETAGIIVIYLKVKPFGERLEEMRALRRDGYRGFKVEVKIVGEVRMCGEG